MDGPGSLSRGVSQMMGTAGMGLASGFIAASLVLGEAESLVLEELDQRPWGLG